MSLPRNKLNMKKYFVKRLEASAQSFKDYKAKEKLAAGREE